MCSSEKEISSISSEVDMESSCVLLLFLLTTLQLRSEGNDESS